MKDLLKCNLKLIGDSDLDILIDREKSVDGSIRSTIMVKLCEEKDRRGTLKTCEPLNHKV